MLPPDIYSDLSPGLRGAFSPPFSRSLTGTHFHPPVRTLSQGKSALAEKKARHAWLRTVNSLNSSSVVRRVRPPAPNSWARSGQGFFVEEGGRNGCAAGVCL